MEGKGCFNKIYHVDSSGAILADKSLELALVVKNCPALLLGKEFFLCLLLVNCL